MTTDPLASADLLTQLLASLPPDEASREDQPGSWRALVRAAQQAPPEHRSAAVAAALAAAVVDAAREPNLERAPAFDLVAQPPSPHPPPDTWPVPIPFSTLSVPPFPAETLPDWLRDFVLAEAIATQTPPDLPGVLALAVLSACCAGHVVVSPWGDWQEPVNLFLMVVLPPGHRRSAVFSSVVRPLHEYEHAAARQLAPRVSEAESVRDLLAQALHRARMLAIHASPDQRDARRAEVHRLAAELRDIVVPTLPRLVVDDCSPERLAGLLHEQAGRIAVMSPEGGIFDLMAGRYSSTGAPNFDHFLKGHAGDPIVVDRVSRPSDLIPRPAITLGLAVQPEVLRSLMARPGFHGKGLLARILYSLPESPLGHRAGDPPAVPTSLRDAYHTAIRSLLARATPPTPAILTLTPGAYQRLLDFYHQVEPRLGEFGDLDLLADWGGKLVGAVARLAGLLHVATHWERCSPWDEPIEAATLEAAIVLGHYFTQHARAAYTVMGSDALADHARYVLRWIERTGVASFSRRDVFRGAMARFRGSRGGVQKLLPVLDALEQHGYIRQRPRRAGPGRPSPTYDVNPSVHRAGQPNPLRSPAGAGFGDFGN